MGREGMLTWNGSTHRAVVCGLVHVCDESCAGISVCWPATHLNGGPVFVTTVL